MTDANNLELEHLIDALMKLAETHARIADSVLVMARNQQQANEVLYAVYSRLEVIAMATGTNLTGRFAYRN